MLKNHNHTQVNLNVPAKVHLSGAEYSDQIAMVTPKNAKTIHKILDIGDAVLERFQKKNFQRSL